MGKKSRRKPRPDAQTAKAKQADDKARLDAATRITERVRPPTSYGLKSAHIDLLFTSSAKMSRALTLESDKSATMDDYYAEDPNSEKRILNKEFPNY